MAEVTGHAAKRLPNHIQTPIGEKPQTVLKPPRNVSPLIRTARWGLLVAGIVYGACRYKILERREHQIQEREVPIKLLMDKRKQERIERESHENMMQLAKDVGVTPKESSAPGSK